MDGFSFSPLIAFANATSAASTSACVAFSSAATFFAFASASANGFQLSAVYALSILAPAALIVALNSVKSTSPLIAFANVSFAASTSACVAFSSATTFFAFARASANAFQLSAVYALSTLDPAAVISADNSVLSTTTSGILSSLLTFQRKIPFAALPDFTVNTSFTAVVVIGSK